MHTMVASPIKIIPCQTYPCQQGAMNPIFPPNYTKNRKVRDLLDTLDPKNEIFTILIQKPVSTKGKSSVKHVEISEWYCIVKKE